jgi:hypothetical protein
VLEVAQRADILREGPYGSAWFAHRDDANAVTHVEIRGPGFKGSLRGGTKSLFRLPGAVSRRSRLVITEAPIDALSIAAIEGICAETLYAAAGAGMGPGRVQAIERLLEQMAQCPDALLASGMAANDGPVPVRTLAHAARLIRESRQFGRYGIVVSEPALEYRRLLVRVREVTKEVRAHSSFRGQIDSAGVAVHERAGIARFVDPHTIKKESGLRLQAEKVIICTGGVTRRLLVPGIEWTATHSDA